MIRRLLKEGKAAECRDARGDRCPCLEIKAARLEGTINHAEKERGLPGFY